MFECQNDHMHASSNTCMCLGERWKENGSNKISSSISYSHIYVAHTCIHVILGKHHVEDAWACKR